MVARIPLIVNPGAAQIQELPTGDSITIPGDLNVTGNITNSGGGFYVADFWTHSSSAPAENTDSYFNGNGYTKTNSASSSVMTVAGGASDGVFTFPSTGMYRIDFTASVNISTGGGTYKLKCKGSRDNGSTWTEDVIDSGALMDHLSSTTESGARLTNHMAFFSVTNTTNDKVKFGVTEPERNGVADYIKIIFMKLN